MDAKDFIKRIAREGIYTSTKESIQVSQEVVYAGLRWLEEHPRIGANVEGGDL